MRISIVVRSFNDLQNIKKLLAMLEEQTYQNFELVFLDNESTDGTREFLTRSGRTFYNINRSSYVPGKVLNLGVSLSEGEIVVFNNSDCIPMDKFWLENLTRPLIKGNDHLLCFSSQKARPNADALVKKDHERAFGKERGAENWPDFFSLASSAFHRDVLVSNPFDENLRYSEDIELFHRLKRKGFKKSYIGQSKVEHSHNYTTSELVRRFYNEGVADFLIFKKNKEFFKDLMIPLGLEVSRDLIYLQKNKKMSEFYKGFIYRIIQRVTYFIGFKLGEGRWI